MPVLLLLPPARGKRTFAYDPKLDGRGGVKRRNRRVGLHSSGYHDLLLHRFGLRIGYNAESPARLVLGNQNAVESDVGNAQAAGEIHHLDGYAAREAVSAIHFDSHPSFTSRLEGQLL